jgi:hypothetical protein
MAPAQDIQSRYQNSGQALHVQPMHAICCGQIELDTEKSMHPTLTRGRVPFVLVDDADCGSPRLGVSSPSTASPRLDELPGYTEERESTMKYNILIWNAYL